MNEVHKLIGALALFVLVLGTIIMIGVIGGCATPTEYTETANVETVDEVLVPTTDALAKGPKSCGGPQPVCEPPQFQVQEWTWNEKKQQYEHSACVCGGDW